MNSQATALLPMQPMTRLPTWLLMAAQVYAPQHVVLVGAGNGTGTLVQGLLTMQGMPQHAGMKAHLLEAHAPTLAQLAKRLGPDSTWQLSADVVLSPHGESNPTYHHYSLGTESSLLPLSELQALWPSLQLISEQPANSGVPINRLLPSPWLLLDCLPAAHLLQGADLAHTHVLLARAVLGAPDTSPSDSTLGQLQAQLAPQGYQLAACFAERNSQLAKTLWLRDPAWLKNQAKDQADQALSEQSKVHEAQAKGMAQELQALQVELAAEAQAKQDLQAQKAKALAQAAELTKANEQSQTQLKAALSDLQQAKAYAEQLAQTHAQQLEKEKAQTDHALSEQSKVHEVQVKSRAQELQSLQTANLEAKQTITLLQAKLVAEVQTKQDLEGKLKELVLQKAQGFELVTDLQTKLDLEIKAKHAVTEAQAEALKHAKDSLKDVETRLRNDMNKGLGNAVKQVESFMRIQSFLGDADCLGDFHGWPISPDIGLFLIERMRGQQYDLIIEFGSGTSTALFAQAINVLNDRASACLSHRVGLNFPKADIVTFEHDKFYFNKTQQLLKSRGLEQRVQLVHAPLIDWSDGDQAYLYYDCEKILSSLAAQYADRQLRILVLVDGPPGSTCKNARYPAVPCVFKAFGRHTIDLVLDDAIRPEEKQVIELWRDFWKKRSFRVTESLIASEKGIYFACSQV